MQSADSIDLDATGQRLKFLRARLCLSQEEVAAAIPLPYRSLQYWESGERKTSRANYDKIAAFYSERLGQRITRDWLLFGVDTAPLPTFPRPGTVEELKQEMAERIDALGVTLRAELLAELELSDHRA